jgi:hypothetical protein
MRGIVLVFGAIATIAGYAYGQDRDQRIADLEQKLRQASDNFVALQKVIESLTTEVQSLREAKTAPSSLSSQTPASGPAALKEELSYQTQVLQPDLSRDERQSELSGRPELFIQARFQQAPIPGATKEIAPSNFTLTRVESRWSGRVSDKIGWALRFSITPRPQGRLSSWLMTPLLNTTRAKRSQSAPGSS